MQTFAYPFQPSSPPKKSPAGRNPCPSFPRIALRPEVPRLTAAHSVLLCHAAPECKLNGIVTLRQPDLPVSVRAAEYVELALAR